MKFLFKKSKQNRHKNYIAYVIIKNLTPKIFSRFISLFSAFSYMVVVNDKDCAH